MIKGVSLALSIILMLSIVGCDAKQEDDTIIIDGTDEAASAFVASKAGQEEAEDDQNESLSEEQILSAIKNYCYASNPVLEEIEKTEVYPVYWEIISRKNEEIVVLFRSYTGMQIRYYVDPATGETYVTELVPGISSEEQQTDESFNVKNYLSDE